MKMGNRDAAESLISTWAAKHLVIKGDVIEQIHVPASTEEVINEDYPPLTLFTYPDNPRAFKGKRRQGNMTQDCLGRWSEAV